MVHIPFHKYKAVIFDVDGTMVDNIAFHRMAWKEFIKNHHLPQTDETLNRFIQGGVRNNEILLDYYGPSLTDDQMLAYVEEKENYYRQLYKKFLKPVNGLIEFLHFLKNIKMPLAIASSAMQKNIDFVTESLDIKNYFTVIVNGDEVYHSKPNPEIFLLAARALAVETRKCLVFEDAISGIDAAHQAGMDVVAIKTVLTDKEAKSADFSLKTFSEITLPSRGV